MKSTRYFEEQVLRKRPYLKRDWIERVLRNPIHQEEQKDEENRMRFWGKIEEYGIILRVVTLSDGETVHNAFIDKHFRG
jgi:hypothetical protein